MVDGEWQRKRSDEVHIAVSKAQWETDPFPDGAGVCNLGKSFLSSGVFLTLLAHR